MTRASSSRGTRRSWHSDAGWPVDCRSTRRWSRSPCADGHRAAVAPAALAAAARPAVHPGDGAGGRDRALRAGPDGARGDWSGGCCVGCTPPSTARTPSRSGPRPSALAVGQRGIVVDRTAAWVHGVTARRPGPAGRARPWPVAPDVRWAARRHLVGRDDRGGLRPSASPRPCARRSTSAGCSRLARRSARWTRCSRAGRSRTPGCSASSPRFTGHRGDRPAARRWRPRWTRGPPAWPSRCCGCTGTQPTCRPRSRACRSPPALAWSGSRLGVERRQFGAVLAHQVSAADLVALEGAGWRVVVLAEERVLHTDPSIWTRHLEREFHQHLLAQVDGEEEVG